MYALTGVGESLQAPIAALTEWAQDNGAALVTFQEQAQEQEREPRPN
jgi:DNA-binding HxlR family transcriptional regulator